MRQSGKAKPKRNIAIYKTVLFPVVSQTKELVSSVFKIAFCLYLSTRHDFTPSQLDSLILELHLNPTPP